MDRGRVPGVARLIFPSQTREEALENIREAIALCLEAGDEPRGELVDVIVAA